MKIIVLLMILNIYQLISQNVPTDWVTVKNDLNPKLKQINFTLDKLNNGKHFPTHYCTNLTLANSNRGYDLINQTNQPYLLAAIDKILEAYELIGLKAIDITIQYPILVESFNNSNLYLEFYKKVFERVRKKGFKIIVGVEATFIDSIWSEQRLVSDVQKFYQGLNPNRYKNEKKLMFQTIINQLKPDYLSFENEPETQKVNTMNLIDFSPQALESYVKYYVSGLQKGTTLVGAGAGTWDDIEYFQRFSNIPELDFIDFHLYPINHNLFDDKAIKIFELAKNGNKKLLISECTLYKVSDKELTSSNNPVAMSALLYSRDCFDFWHEEDSLFLKAIIKYSSIFESLLTNYFWQHHFFQYIPYSSEQFGTMTPGQIMFYMQQQGYQNGLIKKLSWFGELFKKLISESTSIYEEKNHKNEIIISPNPAPDYIEINLDRWSTSRRWTPSEIKIYSPLGECMMTVGVELALPKNEWAQQAMLLQRINISHLPVGLYFIQIGNYSEKFLVVR